MAENPDDTFAQSVVGLAELRNYRSHDDQRLRDHLLERALKSGASLERRVQKLERDNGDYVRQAIIFDQDRGLVPRVKSLEGERDRRNNLGRILLKAAGAVALVALGHYWK